MLCVLNPPHDSRGCVKAISVSYCASALYGRREDQNIMAN